MGYGIYVDDLGVPHSIPIKVTQEGKQIIEIEGVTFEVGDIIIGELQSNPLCSQVTVDNEFANVPSTALTGRKSVRFHNPGNVDIYIRGGTSGDGFTLSPEGWSPEFKTKNETITFQAKVTTGTSTLEVIEGK